jgi:hypothetical protein
MGVATGSELESLLRAQRLVYEVSNLGESSLADFNCE